MDNEIQKIKPKIVKVLKKHNVARAGIFGSYARGEQTKKSDIDIVIDIKTKGFSLLDLIGLEMELERILKRKVDLLTYAGINPYIRKHILDEEIKII